jgi:hypothetical protein
MPESGIRSTRWFARRRPAVRLSRTGLDRLTWSQLPPQDESRDIGRLKNEQSGRNEYSVWNLIFELRIYRIARRQIVATSRRPPGACAVPIESERGSSLLLTRFFTRTGVHFAGTLQVFHTAAQAASQAALPRPTSRFFSRGCTSFFRSCSECCQASGLCL